MGLEMDLVKLKRRMVNEMNISEMIKIVPSNQCPPGRAYLVSKVMDEEKPWETRLSVAALQINDTEQLRSEGRTESADSGGCEEVRDAKD